MVTTAVPRVVLDANVLVPPLLRDTLLHVAAVSFYEPVWSHKILNEVERTLVIKFGALPHKCRSLLGAMKSAFPSAMTRPSSRVIASMGNAEHDRHVAAAAVTAGAGIIVTFNVRDFKGLPKTVRILRPDEFLFEHWESNAARMTAALAKQRAIMKRHPMTVDGILDQLSRTVPRFAAAARARQAE